MSDHEDYCVHNKGVCADRLACAARGCQAVPVDPQRAEISALRRQLREAVKDRGRLRAAVVRCAEKLESLGNEEPAAVASHLRDAANAYGGGEA